jgi:hypothetical protein
MTTRPCHAAFLACCSWLITLPWIGCSSDGQTDSPAQKLSYLQDAKPVVDHYCGDCHSAGGIAPFALTSYEQVKGAASAIQASVEAGRMPPWLPTSAGVPLRFARDMQADHKKLLLDWLKQGAEPGEAGASPRVQIPAAERAAAARADLVLDIGTAYQPSTKGDDDYRCFVIDPGTPASPGLPEARYLRAGEVLPDNKAIAHHVVVFEVGAANAAEALAKDQAEAGPGYPCFGGAGVGGAQIVLAWAVGGGVNRLADNEGTPLAKGSIFVVQMHYNLANYRGVGDRTQTRLEFASTPPEYVVRYLPLLNPSGLKLKAGDADAKQVVVAPVSQILKYLRMPNVTELSITSLLPHMHMLGTTISTGINSQTLLDIDRWQFGWQQTYYLKQPVRATAADLLTLECHFDNSQANQPVIDGKKGVPRDVTWGEGSGDEMCVSLLGVTLPRKP